MILLWFLSKNKDKIDWNFKKIIIEKNFILDSVWNWLLEIFVIVVCYLYIFWYWSSSIIKRTNRKF